MVDFLLLCLSQLVAATIWTVAVVAVLNSKKKPDFQEEYLQARLDNDEVFIKQQKEVIAANNRVADGLRLVGVAMQVSEMRKAKEDVERE